MTTAHIGKSVHRVDGRAKVTGGAKYSAEYDVPDLAHGWVVSSTIARGRIRRIDAGAALALPGVLQVFTHENVPRLARSDRSWSDDVAPPGSPFRPLHDNEIRFSAQPIALVVADTLELARYGATLVHVGYELEEHSTDLESRRADAYEPKKRSGSSLVPSPRGNAKKALARAHVQLDAEYLVPVEHHNPMELFGTTVVHGEDGKLTVYDKTQGCRNVQGYLSSVFGYGKDELRVLSPFVGGAFGSGLRPQCQAFLAVLAARELKRSVRVCLTRQQMFSFGHRPATWQRVALGASKDGDLEAVIHESVSETSRFEDYCEPVVLWSGLLYRCNHVELEQKVVDLDVYTPLDMRAPGATWGVYALECAMDELAVRLGIDPIDLRLRNHAEKDQNAGKRFSSKELRACYAQGAEEFGWARRDPKPGSMRAGNDRIGWGMATGCWEAQQEEASARARLTADGRLTVSSATADIGTGTYTIMTQIAAEELGLPLADVTFELGDSSLPEAPVEGGSFTASTVGSAVKAACDKVRKKLVRLARTIPGSPLRKVDLDDVFFADGRLRSRSDPSRAVAIAEAMRHGKLDAIEKEAAGRPSRKREKFSSYSHSAVFVEVRVDEDFGTVRIARVVTAVAAGRILNPKTARSQVLGGIVGGIGSALEEESVLDHHEDHLDVVDVGLDGHVVLREVVVHEAAAQPLRTERVGYATGRRSREE